MIKNLELNNFSIFSSQDKTPLKIEFSEGINVIIGENSAGKSHLVRLIYCILNTLDNIYNKQSIKKFSKDEKYLYKHLYEKLFNVFRPDESLGRLVTRNKGTSSATVKSTFYNSKERKSFEFTLSRGKGEELTIKEIPNSYPDSTPIFFPAKEVMSLYSWLPFQYQNKEIAIDETYPDLCVALGNLVSKGRKAAEIKSLLKPLERILGGKVILKNNKFYILYDQADNSNIEIDLIAEGARKIAMLSYLISNESLKEKGVLIWDEPEANLNPKWIKELATTLVELCNRGVQVIIATHSLFFMKEMLIQNNGKNPISYIGLSIEQKGKNKYSHIEQSNNLFDLENISSLEEEINQMERESAMKIAKYKN